MANVNDSRPSLVSLDQLSRSARSLSTSSRSLDSRSVSKEESTATPVKNMRVRRLPPRAATVNSALGDSSSDHLSNSIMSPGRRRMLPRRSYSQKFDRRAIIDADLDDEDDTQQ